ncbi:MAG TPA: alanine racemase [Crenotrichaceae bacterium]|nr:alanine racemase [Crenotrichaceae bacterium]
MIEGVIPSTRALVDSSAVRHNLSHVRLHAPHSRVLAVIKANAYGHGLVRIANALHNADALAVARVKEGIVLRNAGIKSRIVVLQGFLDRDELGAHRKFKLEPVVHNDHQLRLLATCAYLDQLHLWIKLDTGMNRLGFQQSDWNAVLEWLNKHRNKYAELIWMTHLANADDISDSTTINQIKLFRSFTETQSEPVSIANSAAILGYKQSHSEWVRPGLMLYGVSPFPDRTGSELGLRPAMTLLSRLVSIKQLRAGDAVGYGGDWVCKQAMRLGVVAIGYGDGYPRNLKPGTLVVINDVTVPVVGRVSMDMLTVDLSACPDAREGDDVVLWGAQLAVENLAKSSSTIAYTLLCGMTRRVGITEVATPQAVARS